MGRSSRHSAFRTSSIWRGEQHEDYDVLADGAVVGRIMKVHAAPVGTPWMWTLAFGHHEDRTPTHGYEPTREAAMGAFAKSWRRERDGQGEQHARDRSCFAQYRNNGFAAHRR